MVVVELNSNSAKLFPLSLALMGDVVWQKVRFACLVHVSVVGQVFSPQM